MLVGAGLIGPKEVFFTADHLARALRLLEAALLWPLKPKQDRDAITTRTRREAVRLFIAD
jgi:hypothetical protein